MFRLGILAHAVNAKPPTLKALAQAQAPAFGFVQAPVGEGSFTAAGQGV